ncbi:hypothetical protein LZ32DRAFT_231836 [Colletotrichum eremochloae]|nr:hypothetical protein LZ32DRAFT_231836 [Colletotrichum eremochloae]
MEEREGRMLRWKDGWTGAWASQSSLEASRRRIARADKTITERGSLLYFVSYLLSTNPLCATKPTTFCPLPTSTNASRV